MMSDMGLVELFIAGGIPTGGVLAQFVHMKIKQATMQTEIDNIIQRFAEEKTDNKENHDKIWEKLDSILELVTQISIEVGKR